MIASLKLTPKKMQYKDVKFRRNPLSTAATFRAVCAIIPSSSIYYKLILDALSQFELKLEQY